MADKQLDILVMEENFDPLQFCYRNIEEALKNNNPEELKELVDRGEKGIYPVGIANTHSRKEWISFAVYNFGSCNNPRKYMGGTGEVMSDKDMEDNQILDERNRKLGDESCRKIFSVSYALPYLYQIIELGIEDMRCLPKKPWPHVVLMNGKDYERLGRMRCVEIGDNYELKAYDITLKPINPRRLV